MFIQSVAYLPVSFYIPTYSTSLGQSATTGQLALAAFNLASVAGQVGIGALTDRFSYLGVAFASAFLSAIAAFVVWGLASTVTVLFVFVVQIGRAHV